MRSEVIAKRYAQALLAASSEQELAEGSGTVPVSAAPVVLLGQVQWYQNVAAASLTPLLGNPRIPIATKERLLEKLLSSHGETKLLFHFIRLLLKKGRIGYLSDIFRLYPKLYEEQMGVKKARLYLAYPMESEVMGRLELKLSARFRRAVVFDVIYDPDILGGFIFATSTERLDASLKRVLTDLGEHLKTVPVV